MAIIPIQNQYPDRAGYLGLDTDRNVLVGMSDGILQDMTNSTPEGWVNVKDFGAKGDGVTDDTQAIQDAILYAYNLSQGMVVGGEGRGFSPTIYFPNGRFRIAQPNILFQGCLQGRFNITGSGRDATILYYDVPSTVDGEYMIYDNNIFGFTTFSDLSFDSANSNGNFFYMYSGAPYHAPQSLYFFNVGFYNFNNLFRIEGTTMDSEIRFVLCKIRGFSGTAFYMNNPQGANWTFLATDIETFSGTVFYLLKGFSVKYITGSIIPSVAGATIIKIPSTANSDYFSVANTPMYFRGVEFEIRPDTILISKEPVAYMDITFDSCDMGGYSDYTGSQIIWNYGGVLVFENSRNFSGYSMNWTGNGAYNADHLTIIIDSPSFPIDNFLTESTFTLTDAAYNVSHYPTLDVRNCANPLLNSTIIKARGASLSNVIQNWHSISTSENATQICAGPFPITIPLSIKNVFIREIKLIPKLSGINGDITFAVTNADETTTLASFTYTPSTDTTEKTSYPNYFVDSTDSLKLKVTGTDTGWKSINGSLWMLY